MNVYKEAEHKLKIRPRVSDFGNTERSYKVQGEDLLPSQFLKHKLYPGVSSLVRSRSLEIDMKTNVQLYF